MKPLSYSQRLTAGFGTIALGICASLPFRRTPDLAEVIPEVPAQSGLALSADVALQLPGTTPSVPETMPQASSPWEIAEESAPETVRANMDDSMKMVPLPSLPDRFQPLENKPPVASSQFGVISEPPQLPQRVVQTRRHKIRDGDTLESLALRFLDDEGRANEIFEANRGILNDPMLLPIGAELTIPSEDCSAAVKPTLTQNHTDSDGLVPLPGRSGR